MIEQEQSEEGVEEVIGSLLLIAITVIFATTIGGFVVLQVQSVPETPHADVTGELEPNSSSPQTVNFTVRNIYNSEAIIFRGSQACSSTELRVNQTGSLTVNDNPISFTLPAASGTVCEVFVIGEINNRETVLDKYTYTAP